MTINNLGNAIVTYYFITFFDKSQFDFSEFSDYNILQQ